jgi:hypothetical protein
MAADWRTHLREAVDDSGCASMSDDARVAMRRLVVAEARASATRSARSSWKRPVAIAAMGVLLIAVGMTSGRRLDLAVNAPSPLIDRSSRVPSDHSVPSRRQLQFATPGGTRVIWVFDPDLHLKGTTP